MTVIILMLVRMLLKVFAREGTSMRRNFVVNVPS